MDDLKKRYTELEHEKSQLSRSNPEDRFRLTIIDQEQAELNRQMSEIERSERQAAELEEIQLPHDYNQVFADPRANEEIRNLIRQAKEQIYAQHNAEIQNFLSEHNSKVSDLLSQISELEEANALLGSGQKDEQDAHAKTKLELLEEKQERHDAEQKRDNAARLLEEAEQEMKRLTKENSSLHTQVNELEGMLRTYKKTPPSSSGLQLTSTLKPETDEERKERIERERLELINRNITSKYGIEPVRFPESPKPAADETVTKEQLDRAFRGASTDETVARGDAGADGIQPAAEALDQAGDAAGGASIEERLTALEKRVADLESDNAILTANFPKAG